MFGTAGMPISWRLRAASWRTVALSLSAASTRARIASAPILARA